MKNSRGNSRGNSRQNQRNSTGNGSYAGAHLKGGSKKSPLYIMGGSNENMNMGKNF